jgi:hypothetical protein
MQGVAKRRNWVKSAFCAKVNVSEGKISISAVSIQTT